MSPITHMIAANDPLVKKFTTVGRTFPHVECKIVDTDGNIVPRGVAGEVRSKGYNNMKF